MTAAGSLRSGTPPRFGAINPITAEDDSDPSSAFEDDLCRMFAGPAVRDTSSSMSTHKYNGAIPDDVYMNDINPLWLDWLSDSIERLPSEALAAVIPQPLPENNPFATSADAEDDINPLWLDWLNDSIERLPSVSLDGSIPPRLPKHIPFATPVENIPFATPAEASAEAPTPSCATTSVRANVSLTSSLALAAARPPSAPVMMPMLMFVPDSRIFVYAPRASVVAPVAAKFELKAAMRDADVDVKVNIDSYVPQTLRPVHPVVRAQQRASRQAALPRFREKKRRCLFKKKIRYQSRQVYADVRPRIKGRFARTDEVAAMRAAGTLPPL